MKRILALLFIAPAIAAADYTQTKATDISLDPPPARGSAADRKDFAELHAFEKTRSKADCDLASRQPHPKFEMFFEDASFDILTKKEIAAAKPLVHKIMEQTIKLTGYYKDKYMRPRPFNTDTTLKPCAEKPTGSKAYPSSHASAAYAGACVLGIIYPKAKRELEEHGLMLGNLRAVVGVHHPSDVAAGQKIGRDFCRILERDATFQNEFRRIR